MARIPIHGRAARGADDQRLVTNLDNQHIKDGLRQKAVIVPELYYLHRGGQVMSMEPVWSRIAQTRRLIMPGRR